MAASSLFDSGGMPAGRLIRASWRSFALAVAAGLLLYAASPGAGGPAALSWIALVPLFLSLHGTRPKIAAQLGLACGLAFYLPLLAWIVTVLSTYGKVHVAVALLALGLLALYMALYPMLLAWTLSRMPQRFHLWFAPVLWVGLDELRAHLFTGFPWQDLAYSQYRLLFPLQIADLAGHHGLTFCIVLANMLVALGILRLTGASEKKHRPGPVQAGGAALLLGLAAVYGFVRLDAFPADAGRRPALPVAVIQGNVPQDQKWVPAYQAATVRDYLALSHEALAAQPVNLLIWPETALPFYLFESALASRLNDVVRSHDSWLLTGAPHREKGGNDGTLRYFNSSFLIGPDGRTSGRYHKQHLVPFGEYIPLRWLLPFFAPIVETLGDFDPGRDQPPLSCGNARLGVLICFESIFPGLAREHAANGANLLINITNDAWFGRSTAPWQHLSMAVFRAVENRRSLARAANTGISGFVLPSGELIAPTPLFTPAFRTAVLPLLESRTLYNRIGYLFGPLCLGLALLGIMVTMRTNRANAQ